MSALQILPLPAGPGFLPAVAQGILALGAERGLGLNLASLHVCVPGLPLASLLRRELGRVAAQPLLLPVCDTLARWAGTQVLQPAPLPESERLLLLRAALAERRWFEEGALWGVAGEMAALFDELTENALALPADEAAFVAELEAAYAIRHSVPLAFEARVVHELWRVLAGLGRPDAPGAYALQLARLAEAAAAPLVAVLDGPPETALKPAEKAFYQRYAERQPVFLYYPMPRQQDGAPLMRTLAAAWPLPDPAQEMAPLLERAHALPARVPASPLAERLQILAARGREQEARGAAALVLQWLQEGKRRIALIAQDRLVARRVRALLERREVLVADETGWKLSTSRAGAVLDGLLETVAGAAYYKDVLDLLKSPFLCDDLRDNARKGAVFALEQAVRRGGVKAGLAGMRRVLQAVDQPTAAQERALALLDRLEAALKLLASRDATLPDWIARLEKAVDALGARQRLLKDAAGAVILDLLAQRREELAESRDRFPFHVFRDWLNRELESEVFRDLSIDSPVLMTHLAATRLRPFEAAVLLGGDAGRLKPAEPAAAFFNQSVRQELGLPTRAVAQERLRADLALLLASVPQVAVTWQEERDGEPQLLAPELDRLAALHRFAWGSSLQGAVAALADPPEGDAARPGPTRRPAPVLAPEAVPLKYSVSAYTALVGCPYRFFARHVLRLNELDEVSEEMEKRDYGLLVHEVLERFHKQYPVLTPVPEAEALAALQALTREVFARALADNYLALGWRLRWEKRLAAYLVWQRQREAEGWYWHDAETKQSRLFPLADGAQVELHGRIDRTDTGPDGYSLLDYKTRSRQAIKSGLEEDLQLAAYAALVGEDAEEAAYVVLDDDKVEALSASEDLQADAQAQAARLVRTVQAMRAGASLPAHGVAALCTYCEMSGLCRYEHVDEMNDGVNASAPGEPHHD